MRLETRIRRLEARAQSQRGCLAEVIARLCRQGSRLPIIDEPGERIEDQADENTPGLLPLLGSSERQIKERAL